MVKQINTKADFDKELADAGGKVRCAPVVALTVVLVVCVSRSGHAAFGAEASGEAGSKQRGGCARVACGGWVRVLRRAFRPPAPPWPDIRLRQPRPGPCSLILGSSSWSTSPPRGAARASASGRSLSKWQTNSLIACSSRSMWTKTRSAAPCCWRGLREWHRNTAPVRSSVCLPAGEKQGPGAD